MYNEIPLHQLNLTEDTLHVKMEYETYIVTVILSLFSLVGVVGNSLVLYGFTRNRQKFTSSLFILTLAGIDLITCLITIPYQMAMELLHFEVSYDIMCKLYHFLTTTTIPFSAFVMVAIAVDRYFCICRPFSRIMTRYRVGIIVVSLGLFSVCLGMLFCLNYGIYQPIDTSKLLAQNDSVLSTTLFKQEDKDRLDVEKRFQDIFRKLNLTDNEFKQVQQHEYNTYHCKETDSLFGKKYFTIYRYIYSSFYALCGIIVILLYSYIYHFILRRRQRRLRMESFPCCTFKVPQHSNDNEQTEVMYLSTEPSTVVDDAREKDKNHNAETQKRPDNDERSRDKFCLGHKKQERIKRNNVKTAVMLSLVAAVFIVAFLPAWLMKHNVVEMNIVVFNMYFIYNVVNPFIYAFMNPEFQQQLKEIFVNACR